MSELTEVSLSSAQLEWLKSHNFLPADLMRYIEIAEIGDNGGFFLSINVADSILDALTVALAEVGFDCNNDLTIKGKALEEIIDQFNVLGDAGD